MDTLRVGVLEEPPRDGVPGLVVGDGFLLLRAENARFLFQSGDDAFDGLLEVLLGHTVALVPRRDESGLVADIVDVGAGEARGECGELIGETFNVLLGLNRFEVNLEDLGATLNIRSVDGNVTIEAAGTHQRRVQDVRPVGAGQDDHVLAGSKTVHLDQELVERTLALIVATELPALAARLADRVDFVHEDDARRVLLRRRKQVPHTRRANAYKHLDEFGTGDAQEGDAGFARRRLGQECLARAGRPGEDGARRDLCAELLVRARVLEELDKLHDLLLRLIHPCHVLELDLHVRLLVEHLRLGLADPKDPLRSTTGAGAPGHVEHHSHKQQGRREVQQGVEHADLVAFPLKRIDRPDAEDICDKAGPRSAVGRDRRGLRPQVHAHLGPVHDYQLLHQALVQERVAEVLPCDLTRVLPLAHHTPQEPRPECHGKDGVVANPYFRYVLTVAAAAAVAA
ncbi:LOW QUALITY PROTEIN: hypothetical protein BC936DRAFT_141968 [Jimgerdemannia flammicorona]|uniref:Uncharacterized protein n=1 Tax=Jimgerdemannia flammicorona TaxID=994334 RepID=A0A433DFJ6_9FUNG|nr:LOW QUALITY PROTEIN: hypothetical protein BC936DRAFT_141968 [Jimgerdemannia flammicorona]